MSVGDFSPFRLFLVMSMGKREWTADRDRGREREGEQAIGMGWSDRPSGCVCRNHGRRRGERRGEGGNNELGAPKSFVFVRGCRNGQVWRRRVSQ